MTDGLEGFDELNGKLTDLLRLDATPGLIAGAEKLKAAIQENIRSKLNKNSSGALEGQVQIVVTKKDTAEVGIQKDVYGRTHEFGATIVPKKAEALHFEIDGQEIFAKKVVIPKRPFMRPAADENRDSIADAIGEALAKLIEEATR